MNAVMCMMSECVQCYRPTLTLVGQPIVICRDCLYDRQPMSYQTRLPKPLPPRWKTWPGFILAMFTYVWVLSLAMDTPWLFRAVAVVTNGLLMFRGSRRIRARAARHRSELQSARNEALRKRIGGWDAAE